MPVLPRDIHLTPAQTMTIRALLADWDARDPWAAQPALEQRLSAVLTSVVAPRVVFMASAVHAAKFLRDTLTHGTHNAPPSEDSGA